MLRATVKKAGKDGSHAQLERGVITIEEFLELFATEYKQRIGMTVDPSVITTMISPLKELIAKPGKKCWMLLGSWRP